MLKILSCIFMLIDHIGVIFFPSYIWFRILGRFSMPIFAYCIAKGFYYSSINKSLNKYKKRLLILALLSQIPYSIMEKNFELNIIFLWLFSIIFLENLTETKKEIKNYLLIFIIILVFILVKIDYGLYGFLNVLLFYLLFYNKKLKYKIELALILFAILEILNVIFSKNYFSVVQTFSYFSVLSILILKKYDVRVKANKLIFYLFYPMHILVLLILKYLFIK